MYVNYFLDIKEKTKQTHKQSPPPKTKKPIKQNRQHNNKGKNTHIMQKITLQQQKYYFNTDNKQK